jgi:hypothetical protein
MLLATRVYSKWSDTGGVSWLYKGEPEMPYAHKAE